MQNIIVSIYNYKVIKLCFLANYKLHGKKAVLHSKPTNH